MCVCLLSIHARPSSCAQEWRRSAQSRLRFERIDTLYMLCVYSVVVLYLLYPSHPSQRGSWWCVQQQTFSSHYRPMCFALFFLSTMYIFALWFVPYVVFFLCACCCSNFFLLPNWINFFSLVTLDAVRICARVFFFCFFFVFFWEERWMCSLIKDFVSYWRGTRVYTAARRETVRYWSASERLEGQRWQRDRFF